MTKRFCNSCETEIRLDKLYFCIRLNALIEGNWASDTTFFKDYCYDCVKSGKWTEGISDMAQRLKDLIMGIPHKRIDNALEILGDTGTQHFEN